MHRKRAHVVLPDDLLVEVDALVGPRGRSAFLTEVIRREVNRRRLLQMLSGPEPILNDADYPELHDGSDAFVRRLREADRERDEELLSEWLARPRE